MDKRICIVHANCQGEPLIERLQLCPEFADRYECRLYTNYVREHIPDESLSKCALFLYKFLGPEWNDLGSETLLAKLPESAQSLCIPNMFFLGYWPLWSHEPGFDYRDRLLDDLIDRGLRAEEITTLYLRSNPSKQVDFERLIAASLRREREREQHTPIKYLDYLIENHGKERLFHTVNHPGSTLLNRAAKDILGHLGFPAPEDAKLEALDEPFAEFDLPIHPAIAAHFGWPFGGPNEEYQIYGRTLSFARYVANYIVARQEGVTDFIGFLTGADHGE